MSKIPKHGAVPLLYVVEESRGHAWRPLGAGSLDQRVALVMLDAQVSSYTRRVVQVVAVRFPPESSQNDRIQAYLNSPRAEEARLPPACAMQDCEAPAAPGSRWCAAHSAGLPSNARREGEFPRPRGVTL